MLTSQILVRPPSRNIFVPLIILLLIFLLGLMSARCAYAKPTVRAKFYDFSATVIDGEIKKPTTLYTNARQKVKFDRLMKLKKSFIPQLFKTAKERVFK